MGVSHPNKGEPAAAPEQGDASRDADQISPDEWPLRPLSAEIKDRRPQYQVVFHPATVDDIRAHGKSSPEAEVCGVLVGNVYRDRSGPYCYIKANIRGNHAPGRNAQVTFTSETWTNIHEQMDSRYPDDRIVGWYHTHPGFGIFLSEMDLFIQNNFFNEPWQIAYVDDPKGGDRGAFVWEKGAAVRRPYLIESKPAVPAVMTCTVSSPNFDSTVRLEPVAPNERPRQGVELLETAARMRLMERQVRAYRRRFRWTLLIAFVWPILLFVALASAGVISTEKLKGMTPVKWGVDKWNGISARVSGHK